MRALLNRLPRTRIKLAVARKLYMALRLVLRRDRYCIERGGIRYEVDLSEGLDLSLFLFGSFQKHVTDVKYIKIPEDSIVIDVGANAGLMSLRYARTAARGRVYAFEPTHSGYARLKRNLGLNPELAARVIPVQAFVSDVAE
jgi:tRNA G37 N-methylase Trm5